MRLHSYLKAFRGFTKSEVMNYYKKGLITVNDVPQKLSYKIQKGDLIKIGNEIIIEKPFVYYLYYKPKGVLSTIRNCDYSYINAISLKDKVSPAGRLDKNSEGLMLLSNDGNFLHDYSKPNSHKKIYIVTLGNKITDSFIMNISKSYELDGRITTPFKTEIIDDYNVNLELNEGLYHQIRRIVKLSGNNVINLKRISIGKYELGDMKPGEIRKIIDF